MVVLGYKFLRNSSVVVAVDYSEYIGIRGGTVDVNLDKFTYEPTDVSDYIVEYDPYTINLKEIERQHILTGTLEEPWKNTKNMLTHELRYEDIGGTIMLYDILEFFTTKYHSAIPRIANLVRFVLCLDHIKNMYDVKLDVLRRHFKPNLRGIIRGLERFEEAFSNEISHNRLYKWWRQIMSNLCSINTELEIFADLRFAGYNAKFSDRPSGPDMFIEDVSIEVKSIFTSSIHEKKLNHVLSISPR